MPKAAKVDLAQLTPFARALQEWMWRQYPPIQTRVELAERLGIARSTVESWFSPDPARQALPTGRGYHAVQRLTGWPKARMLELTDYPAEPLDNPTAWELLRERAPGRFSDPGVLANVMRWLDDVQAEHKALASGQPQRQRRRKRQPVTATATTTTAETPASSASAPSTPAAPTPATRTARRDGHEKVGSGR